MVSIRIGGLDCSNDQIRKLKLDQCRKLHQPEKEKTMTFQTAFKKLYEKELKPYDF